MITSAVLPHYRRYPLMWWRKWKEILHREMRPGLPIQRWLLIDRAVAQKLNINTEWNAACGSRLSGIVSKPTQLYEAMQYENTQPPKSFILVTLTLQVASSTVEATERGLESFTWRSRWLWLVFPVQGYTSASFTVSASARSWLVGWLAVRCFLVRRTPVQLGV